MTRNTNNNSDQVNAQIQENFELHLYDDLHEELLYEVLLYKKKDIIAIQEKLGMTMGSRKRPPLSINDNTNQTALNQSKKAEILDYTNRLLFNLVEIIISIEEHLEISGYLTLNTLHRYRKDLINRSLEEFSLREKYHLLLYLEEDISIIQAYLDIVGYTNEETIKEDTEKDVRAYIQKFRRSKCSNTEIRE